MKLTHSIFDYIPKEKKDYHTFIERIPFPIIGIPQNYVRHSKLGDLKKI